MRKLAVILVLVVAASGTGVLLYLRSQDARPPVIRLADVASVARLTCVDGGTKLLTPTIQVQETGIHFLIDNRDGARQYYFTVKDESDNNNGGRLKPGLNRIETDIPPGTISATCMYRPQEFDTHFVDVRVLDPQQHYIRPELACEVADESEMSVPRDDPKGYVLEDPAAFIREHVEGLQTTDLVVKPGYSDTQYHSDYNLIVRDGEAIAGVDVWSRGSRWWDVAVSSCEGSGISAG